MLLSEKFTRCFDEATRAQAPGFLDGASRIWGGDERIKCDFDDGCSCSLTLEARRLTPQCDCQSFKDGTLCTHLWCALLLADKYGDLTKALKRNVPASLLSATPYPDDAPNYVPERSRKKRPPAKPRDDGTVIEYDVPPPTRKTHADDTPPTVLPSPGVAIIFLVRPDVEPRLSTSLTVETWWRSTGKIEPFIITNASNVNTPDEARAIELMLPFKCAPARFTIPADNCPALFESLQLCPNLRWADITPAGRTMRKLSVPLALPAVFTLNVLPQPNGSYEVRPALNSQFGTIPFSRVKRVIQTHDNNDAFVIADSMLLRAVFNGAASIAAQFTGQDYIILNQTDATTLAATVALSSELNTDVFPPAIRVPRSTAHPVPALFIQTARFKFNDHEQLQAELSFTYNGITCPDDRQSRLAAPSAVILRDIDAETNCRERLRELGFRYVTRSSQEDPGWKLAPARLNDTVLTLVNEGWHVTAMGKSYRKPVKKEMHLKSGVDWFELDAVVVFNGQEVPLPKLLKAMQSGANTVRLDDGTYGILPIEWLKNFTVLTELGDVTDKHLKFRMEQAALINALLNQRNLEADKRFREHLNAFDELASPHPATPPKQFKATLRPYQEIGLGWLLNMQQHGLGACLADDMGLGKTIQILALLAKRSLLPCPRPSLIVMPSSLIFNWLSEAHNFAPWLKCRVHHGPARQCTEAALGTANCVFTTYGTLRNDAPKLALIEFDYCILDEAQAIKNHDSSTAQAARCINARFRVTMTGTPVENSIYELFSQLDFLNPGLFGSLRLFAGRAQAALQSPEMRRIKDAVRPFILRRTKEQVATELPPKTEQILWCDLFDNDRLEYDELLHYYQNKLKQDTPGQEMLVLAALTRLRQAACHPALLNETRINDTSAKLELLMNRLDTILAAGHRTLVFSQFTKFLKIIRQRIDDSGYGFSYLDGETPNRQQVVNDFQNNPARQVFLISLKAGGVGLNLTAADYVFIMDPWWNPAVEAQAIDRAYRIGQTQPVMAYRIVTRNTIEEKVIQLQTAKRKLADTLVGNDINTPTALTKNELRELLS